MSRAVRREVTTAGGLTPVIEGDFYIGTKRAAPKGAKGSRKLFYCSGQYYRSQKTILLKVWHVKVKSLH
jgi:hypothetical protein